MTNTRSALRRLRIPRTSIQPDAIPSDTGENFRTHGDAIAAGGAAGHVLGSSQVRIEHRGEVWVFTGDYKRQPDPTCVPFELVKCSTLITECTFGLPIFRWRDPQLVADEMNQWWRNNVEIGRTSVLLAYPLGKSQRVLSLLDPTIAPILLHGATYAMVEAYRERLTLQRRLGNRPLGFSEQRVNHRRFGLTTSVISSLLARIFMRKLRLLPIVAMPSSRLSRVRSKRVKLFRDMGPWPPLAHA